jgi:Amt family ammonium transporter
VHLVNGVFGTLCVGLFGHPEKIGRSANSGHTAGLFYGGGVEQLVDQLIGVVATGLYVCVTAGIAWLVLKAVIGIRVSAEEERDGLDHGEHGNEAYHGFVMASTPEGYACNATCLAADHR